MPIALPSEMMRATRTFGVLLAGTIAVLGLLVETARAQPAKQDESDEAVVSTKPAIDLEYVVVLGRDLDAGLGGAFRLGREFGGLLSLTPELGASFHSLNGVYDASLYRGFVGFRLAIGTVIEPGFFGHLGYGYIAFRDVSEPLDRSHSAFMYDGGVSLDYRLFPVLDVGLHAAYNGFKASDDFGAVHWISTGGHVAIRFVSD